MSEIRDWAVANGLMDEGGRGPIPARVREEWEKRDAPEPDDDLDDEPVVVAVPSLPGPAGGEQPEPGRGANPQPARAGEPRRPETPPQGRKVSAAERFRKRINAAPKTRQKRVSIEDVVSSIWGLGGLALMQNPATVPVGRVLAVQAGVAGIVVEDVAKGTVVDKVLQPIARMEEKGKAAMALLGPPILVGLITARPELAPAVRPVLKASMLTWLEISAPAMEKAQKRAEKFAADYGGIDLDAIIDSFWSTEGLPVAESADEEAAVRRARGE